MVAKKRVPVLRKQSHDQNLKNKPTFPKEFLNTILLKVGEYKYIYIFEIFFNSLFCLKMAAKTVLSYCKMRLIYAN